MRHLLAERRATVARRIDAEQAQLAAIERASAISEDAQPTYDIVLREVPAVWSESAPGGARLWPVRLAARRDRQDTAQEPARIAGHGAVWHHWRPAQTAIDCEAMVLLERPISAPRNLKFYQLAGLPRGLRLHPSDEEAFAPACAAAWEAVATSHSSSNEARCASVLLEAPAIRASTSPRSSSTASVHRSQRMTVTLSSPKTMPRLRAIPDRRGHEGKIVLMRPGLRHDTAGNLVGGNDFRPPRWSRCQEPRCAVRAAGGTSTTS